MQRVYFAGLMIAGITIALMETGNQAIATDDTIATAVQDATALLTPDTLAKLETGEFIVLKKGTKDATGNNQGDGRVLALIHRPASDVYDQLARSEEHPTFMPHLNKVERYFDHGNEIGIQETIKIAFKTIQYHVIQKRDRDHRVIAWTLDKSKPNSIQETTGSWVIQPHSDDTCIAVYTLRVDSGMYFPKVIEDFLFNQDLPNIVRALKKRCESSPTTVPTDN